MILTLDFETFYDVKYTLKAMRTSDYVRDPRFAVLGVGLKVDHAPAYWVPEAEVEYALRSFDWENLTLLCHNAPFDGFILSDRYGLRPRFTLDTMAMGRALHGMITGASLDALAKHEGLAGKLEGTLASMKGVRHPTPEQDRALGAYCVQDVELTHALYHKWRGAFPARELRVIDVFNQMVIRPAICLDPEALRTALDEERTAIEETVRACGLPGTLEQQKKVLRSRTQFPALLRAVGVEPPEKISARTGKLTGAFAKGDDAFTQYLDHPTAAPLVAAKLALSSSLRETRTASLLRTAEQNPVLPVFLSYWGALTTGRAAGGGNKDNLQNLPRKSALRDAIVAAAGYLLVVSDLASIEARVLSWSARDEALLAAFRLGADPYLLMASDVYGRPVVKDEKDKRSLGKVLVLGLGYGLGFLKLARSLFDGMMGNPPVIFTIQAAQDMRIDWRPTIEWFQSRDDTFKDRIRMLKPVSMSIGHWLFQCAVALHLVQIYRSARGPVKEYWADCGAALKWMADGHEAEVGRGVWTRKNALVLPDGMTLLYPNLRRRESDDNWVYDKANMKRGNGRPDVVPVYAGKLAENITQALAGAVLREHMARLAALGLYAKLQVHDELVFVAREDEAPEVARRVQAVMASPPSWAPDMPVGAETGIGRRYSEAK